MKTDNKSKKAVDDRSFFGEKKEYDRGRAEKKLRSFQQSELNAMTMYRALAERAEEEKTRDLLQKIAADEGRHAAVFRGLTCVTLPIRKGLLRAVLCMKVVLREKNTYRVLAFGEKRASKTYERFVERYGINEVTPLIDAEKEHAERLSATARKKK